MPDVSRLYRALLILTLLVAAAHDARAQDILTLRGPGADLGATFIAPAPPAPTRGAVVAKVQANSPAEKAGLRTGDFVTTFDGIAVRDPRHLLLLIAETPPGRAVSVAFVRAGRASVLKVSPILGRSLG
jgi:S1-C subfamily serine protease